MNMFTSMTLLVICATRNVYNKANKLVYLLRYFPVSIMSNGEFDYIFCLITCITMEPLLALLALH